jgi:hypothetical protein
MATDAELRALVDGMAESFRPYHHFSPEADALTVYFKPDQDYSKRLTDHVTLYLSVDTGEIVGCRLKGISGIIEDLPNYLHIDHGGARISVLFWAFRGGVLDEDVRKTLNELARATSGMTLEPTFAD